MYILLTLLIPVLLGISRYLLGKVKEMKVFFSENTFQWTADFIMDVTYYQYGLKVSAMKRNFFKD